MYLHTSALTDGHDSVLFRMQQGLVVWLSSPYHLYTHHAWPHSLITLGRSWCAS